MTFNFLCYDNMFLSHAIARGRKLAEVGHEVKPARNIKAEHNYACSWNCKSSRITK